MTERLHDAPSREGSEVGEVTIVRFNLMNRAGYSPYCGKNDCRLGMPRTFWRGEQFECGCGWRSGFTDDFVKRYKAKWSLP